jgi:hypothetical protein
LKSGGEKLFVIEVFELVFDTSHHDDDDNDDDDGFLTNINSVWYSRVWVCKVQIAGRLTASSTLGTTPICHEDGGLLGT